MPTWPAPPTTATWYLDFIGMLQNGSISAEVEHEDTGLPLQGQKFRLVGAPRKLSGQQPSTCPEFEDFPHPSLHSTLLRPGKAALHLHSLLSFTETEASPTAAASPLPDGRRRCLSPPLRCGRRSPSPFPLA